MPATKNKFQTAYANHPRVKKDPGGPSLTKQAFAAETNINVILTKYHATGLLDHVNTHKGEYMDLVLSTDYHQNMTALIEAQASFDSLPSGLRNRFYNDPAQFLEFVQDPENFDEMVALGLAEMPSQADPEGTPNAPKAPEEGGQLEPEEAPPAAP